MILEDWTNDQLHESYKKKTFINDGFIFDKFGKEKKNARFNNQPKIT